MSSVLAELRHAVNGVGCDMHRLKVSLIAALTLVAGSLSYSENEKPDSLEVLFIGNSYTARHSLSQVVKAMAEETHPGLEFNVSTVIYGGRRLVDHWRLGTQNIVNLNALTKEQIEAAITSLEADLEKDPKDNHAKSAITRQKDLLANLEERRTTWDIVVLQSYRDDLEGEPSLYAEYAPKFTELAKAQGARVILYETTPNTQNAKSLETAPDREVVMEKEKAIAALANQLDVAVAPMSLVAFNVQTERPDFTLRFINDAHLNHTMAYLTACTIYAAMFDKSPVGLKVDTITDIRFFNNTEKDKDRDGEPISRQFAGKDLADLQRIAWESYKEFQELRTM